MTRFLTRVFYIMAKWFEVALCVFIETTPEVFEA